MNSTHPLACNRLIDINQVEHRIKQTWPNCGLPKIFLQNVAKFNDVYLFCNVSFYMTKRQPFFFAAVRSAIYLLKTELRTKKSGHTWNKVRIWFDLIVWIFFPCPLSVLEEPLLDPCYPIRAVRGKIPWAACLQSSRPRFYYLNFCCCNL